MGLEQNKATVTAFYDLMFNHRSAGRCQQNSNFCRVEKRTAFERQHRDEQRHREPDRPEPRAAEINEGPIASRKAGQCATASGIASSANDWRATTESCSKWSTRMRPTMLIASLDDHRRRDARTFSPRRTVVFIACSGPYANGIS